MLYLNDVEKTTSWDRPNEHPRPKNPEKRLPKVVSNTVDNADHPKSRTPSHGRTSISGPPPRLPARPDHNGSARALEDVPPPSYGQHINGEAAPQQVRSCVAHPREQTMCVVGFSCRATFQCQGWTRFKHGAAWEAGGRFIRTLGLRALCYTYCLSIEIMVRIRGGTKRLSPPSVSGL